MLSYQYTARNSATGEKIKSSVQAESESAAASLVRKEGLTPIDISLDKKALGGGRRKRVSAKDRILFSRQLSTLINAGLPLVQSLNNVNAQSTSKPLKLIGGEVIRDVEAGQTLSKAMAKHPRVFNRVYVSMIAAGETSGTLDVSLQRLALQQEKDAEIISKVRGAMIYPIIVLLVMAAVVGFMLVKVLPQVKILYTSFPGANLPLVTRILLSLSDFVVHYWWLVILVVVVAVFLGSRYARTGPGKSIVDTFKMRFPLIGRLFMKMYMARFARTGSTLVSSGVPLIQVLEITADAVNNVHIERSIDGAIDKVRGGKSLADALDHDDNFLQLVPNMLRIGEQSGALEDMLAKTADYYEKEVDDEIKNVQTIIEPFMMVTLGVVALIIVAAVLLPVYGLAGNSFSV